MELLNNIWMALSTPNELIMNVITVLTSFIEMFFIFKIFTLILKITYTKKQSLIYIFSCSILCTVSNFIFSSPVNTIINYIVMFIFSYFILKLSIIKSCLSVLLPIIIFALITTLIINPYLTIFNISSNDLSAIPIYKIIYLIILYVIIGIIVFVLKNKN